MQAQAGFLGDAEQTLDHIGFDGDQEHLQFAGGRSAQNLVVPDHFLQREGDVLLRLILDDLGDLGGVDGRQFDELGEGVIAGSADVDVPRVVGVLAEHLLDSLEHGRLPGGFLGAIRTSEGAGRALATIPLLWLELLVVGAGTGVGMLGYALGRRY